MLAVAALSARMLAELALISGQRVVALDLFGDADTRAAAADWQPIGEPLRIEPAALLEALAALAARGRVQGWIAGSGFEAEGDLLERADRCLPLIGTAPADLHRLRDARHFFGTLRELALAHPPVRFEPPDDGAGWLVKNLASCGGQGVYRVSSKARADAGPTPSANPGIYWQRERAAPTMSATLVANGREAVLLGINQQLTQAIGTRPYVFTGVLGPVPASASLLRQVRQAATALAGRYRLRGLVSLDFLLRDHEPEWLEVNARVPASAALYTALDPLGLHLRACRSGELPAVLPPIDGVQGECIVFADGTRRLSAAQAELIASWPGTHDLPLPGSTFEAGAPLCSLGARGRTPEEVRVRLAEGSSALLHALHHHTLAIT